MTPLINPFPPHGNAFGMSDAQTTHTKDFDLMDVIYRNILEIRGDRAKYIRVENFNVDLFMGESRTKVLNRAFNILVWNPDVVEDNITHGFAKSGFQFVNEGEITYYCPTSYFRECIEDERTFENQEIMNQSSFIQDNVLYFYNIDLTDTRLYSFIAAGDTITLNGCYNPSNDSDYLVASILYNEIEVNTGLGNTEYIWRSEITLTPNQDPSEPSDPSEIIEIIDEELPSEATIYIRKFVSITPKINDLIWVPKLEQLYQIEYVNDTPPHLMFNRNLSYVFNVGLYDYNSNIKVESQVISEIPQLSELQDLNELVLDISNDIINNEITTHDIIDNTEEQARDTNQKPTNKFER